MTAPKLDFPVPIGLRSRTKSGAAAPLFRFRDMGGSLFDRLAGDT
jgi:hypothetical protein